MVSNSDGTNTTTSPVAGALRDWHTYVIAWAPSGFRVSVDGTRRSLDPAVSTEPRWFGFAVTTGDEADTPAEFQIDYLRIWAFDPVASAPAARPSTVDSARRGAPGPALVALAGRGRGHGALVIHKTRPYRPPSALRA
ncbi:hypothetical protein [Dactylosporangium sp. CA-233914]|uniref:hypothetical protein n=1 Tax=Dactylosporangium sp. CA-233914 TaxID=3239934 RepID=UPI003D8D9149